MDRVLTGDGKVEGVTKGRTVQRVQATTNSRLGWCRFERKRGKFCSTGWVHSMKALGHPAGSAAKPLLDAKPLGVMSIRIK